MLRLPDFACERCCCAVCRQRRSYLLLEPQRHRGRRGRSPGTSFSCVPPAPSSLLSEPQRYRGRRHEGEARRGPEPSRHQNPGSSCRTSTGERSYGDRLRCRIGRPQGAPLHVRLSHSVPLRLLRSAGACRGRQGPFRYSDATPERVHGGDLEGRGCPCHAHVQRAPFNLQRSTGNLPPSTCNPQPASLALTIKKGTLLLLHSLVIGVMIRTGAHVLHTSSISLGSLIFVQKAIAADR